MFKVIILAVCVSVPTWGVSYAEDATPPRPAVAERPSQVTQPAATIPMRPVMLEIQQVLDAGKTEMADLETAYRTALTNEAALQIQKRMQALAVKTELDVMTIQLRHLRRTGHEEQAVALENTLAEMTAPKPVRTPVQRPAASSSTGRR